jgi:tRNA threonylcarbamoyl adenosine modification protein YeaZ
MITLLLDSSNTKLAVAIAKNDEILGYKYYDAWQRQSEYMMSEINNLLKEHNIDPLEVGEIISSKGPGSYTGVRISLTIAKIWGFCRDIKVFAVSSLRILKKNDSPSLCVINARSSRSYVGIYHNDEVIMEDTLLTNEEVLKLIEEQPNLVLCGETQYLKKEGYLTDIFEQMLKIRKVSEPVEDILALKPVYLKN